MKRCIHRFVPYKSISWYTALLLFVFIAYFTFYYATPNPLSWDNLGYHVYLSELINDGNLRVPDLGYYERIMEQYKNTTTLYQFVPTNHEALGGYITKYTSGWALLNAPFVYAGHVWAGWFGYAQDGFSKPYQIAVIISSFFYTLIGLLFLRKICLHFFTEKITSILLLILVLGTNYLHLHAESTATIHIYLFTLYTLLIWLTIQFYQSKTRLKAILIGVVIAFMILIRPTELLAVLIPLLYGVTSFADLKKRFIEFFTTSYYYWAIGFLLLVDSVQLVYWKYTTGKFLVYTYNNEGEGLDFHLPHLIDVLFSFRKGWFIYTPLMLLLIFGFIQLYKQKREWFWGLFVFTILNLYVISCWTTWWYADSFSQRSLSHTYPIYILVIGFIFVHIKGLKRMLLVGFIVLSIGLNLFQSWQARYGILHLSRITAAYYFSVFGQTTDPTEEQLKLLSIDYDLKSFENRAEYKLITTIQPSYNLPFTLDSETEQTPLETIPFETLTASDHLWVRATAKIEPLFADSLYKAENFAAHLCICMLHKKRTYAWRNVSALTIDQAGVILTQDYLTPHPRFLSDEISVSVWLQYGPAIQVTNLSFEIYEKK